MLLLDAKSAAADEVDDLDAVAGGERVAVPRRPRHDVLVHLDRDAAGGDSEPREQRRDRGRLGEIAGLAVDREGEGRGRRHRCERATAARRAQNLSEGFPLAARRPWTSTAPSTV